MEKKWADLGYPVNVNSDTQPLLKKIKLEPGASPTENDNTLLVLNAIARIAVLEEQFKKHFGEFPIEQPPNANLEPSLAPAPGSTHERANKSKRKAQRQQRKQNESTTKLSESKGPECPETSEPGHSRTELAKAEKKAKKKLRRHDHDKELKQSNREEMSESEAVPQALGACQWLKTETPDEISEDVPDEFLAFAFEAEDNAGLGPSEKDLTRAEKKAKKELERRRKELNKLNPKEGLESEHEYFSQTVEGGSKWLKSEEPDHISGNEPKSDILEDTGAEKNAKKESKRRRKELNKLNPKEGLESQHFSQTVKSEEPDQISENDLKSANLEDTGAKKKAKKELKRRHKESNPKEGLESEDVPETVGDIESLKYEEQDTISENEVRSDDVEDENNDGTGPELFQSQLPLTLAEEIRAKKKLKRQRSKLNRAGRFSCWWCPAAFARLKGLKTHVKTKHKRLIFGCSNCVLLFPTEEEQQEHDTANHRFYCGFCPGWRIRTEHFRDRHVQQVHGIRSMTCHVCGVTLSCYPDVVSHLKEHESETGQRFIFQCGKCIKPFYCYTEEAMDNHMVINFHRTFGDGRHLSHRINSS